MRGLILVATLALGGCVQSQFYYHADNVRVDQDPVRFKQFELDKVICNGEAAKAGIGLPPQSFSVRSSIQTVYEGCMAQKGYISRAS